MAVAPEARYRNIAKKRFIPLKTTNSVQVLVDDDESRFRRLA